MEFIQPNKPSKQSIVVQEGQVVDFEIESC